MLLAVTIGLVVLTKPFCCAAAMLPGVAEGGSWKILKQKSFAHEAAGAPGTRHSPRPLFLGRSFCKRSLASRREAEKPCVRLDRRYARIDWFSLAEICLLGG
jgi:hypothetical protein